jgi:glycosyltransferase involved in cell wall biosynthesis
VKILFFSSAFPQPGDLSRSPYNLHRCRALAQKHQVRVISPLNWRHQSASERSAPLERFHVERPVFYYPPRVLRGTHSWWMWQSVKATASRVCREFAPDVVLSYWTYPDGAVATRIARRAGIPCVAIVGGSDVLAIDANAPDAEGRRVVRVLSGVDAIATVSDHLGARIAALGVPSQKVHILPPAVDTGVFSPGDRNEARRVLNIATDTQMLFWAGRLVEVKALDILLDAVRKALTDCPRLRLYLVGDGPLRRALTAQAKANGLSERVHFVGRVLQNELATWYRAANITVLPSHWEGTPNVLLESHACGTPFVATRVGAIPKLAVESVDHLVAPGNPSDLAAAIARALNRPADEGANGRMSIGGWEKTADRLTEVLRAACDSNVAKARAMAQTCLAEN